MKQRKSFSPHIFKTTRESPHISKAKILAVIVSFAVIGSIFIFLSHAATPTASIEPETATITSPAIAGTDSGASGGKYVQFTAAGPVPTGSVTYGWQLTDTNTGLNGVGVSRSSLPTFTGTISTGQTISNVKITSCVDLTNMANVTLNHVLLMPSGCTAALRLGTGTVIKDSDIDGTNMVQAERQALITGATGFSIQRLNITNVSIGAWLDGSGSMTDTYIHNMVAPGGAHADGFTRRGGTGALALTRDRIDDTTNGTTGAFFLQNTWGAQIAGITLKDSYLEGNGYTMALENKGPGTSLGVSNVRLRAIGWGPYYNDGGVTFTQWVNVYVYSATAANNAGAALGQP